MVKIALRKLFAGILCGCVVLLVLVGEVSEGITPSKPIHILTALFTTRIHKENKQVLPYQPTSGKLWPTQSTVCVSFSMLENRTETHARTNMVKIALRKLFAGILCGCVELHTHATLHIYHMFIFYLHMLFAYSICCLGS